MAQIIGFKPEHLFEIDVRWPEAIEFGAMNNRHAVAQMCSVSGPAYTMLNDDRKPIASAGMAIIWRGVADGWAFTSNEIIDYRFAFHRAFVELLDMTQKLNSIRRIQTVVHEGNDASFRWLNRLGFENEGIMKSYGPDGANYYRLARII